MEKSEWIAKNCSPFFCSMQDGFVELREFTKIVQLLQQYDEISKVFEELDTNDDHRISLKEFKRGYELLGDDSSDEDRLREEFDAIDTNDGGQILFDEVRTRRIQFDMILSFVFHFQFCMYMANKRVH